MRPTNERPRPYVVVLCYDDYNRILLFKRHPSKLDSNPGWQAPSMRLPFGYSFEAVANLLVRRNYRRSPQFIESFSIPFNLLDEHDGVCIRHQMFMVMSARVDSSFVVPQPHGLFREVGLFEMAEMGDDELDSDTLRIINHVDEQFEADDLRNDGAPLAFWYDSIPADNQDPIPGMELIA